MKHQVFWNAKIDRVIVSVVQGGSANGKCQNDGTRDQKGEPTFIEIIRKREPNTIRKTDAAKHS